MPKILNYPELNARGVRLSRRQLDRLEGAGKFPRRVQISPGRVGWQIDAHVATVIGRRLARISSDNEPTAVIRA